MANHHPDRACFSQIDYDDTGHVIRYTFTADSKDRPVDPGDAPYVYDVTFPDGTTYDAAKAAGTDGTYYNEEVRNVYPHAKV